MHKLILDRDSARLVELPFSSPHKLYKDKNGFHVLYCASRLSGGGVSLHHETYMHVMKMQCFEEQKQVYLTNLQEPTWAWVGQAGDLPYKDPMDGKLGLYRIYDKEDLFEDAPHKLPSDLEAALGTHQFPVGFPKVSVESFEEISLAEFGNRIGRALSNPDLEKIRHLTKEHNVEFMVRDGTLTIRWYGKKEGT